jgi:hypothetical protein
VLFGGNGALINNIARLLLCRSPIFASADEVSIEWVLSTSKILRI